MRPAIRPTAAQSFPNVPVYGHRARVIVEICNADSSPTEPTTTSKKDEEPGQNKTNPLQATFAKHRGQLISTVPSVWYGSGTVPTKTVRRPALSPVVVGEPEIIVRDTELKSARLTSLMRRVPLLIARREL